MTKHEAAGLEPVPPTYRNDPFVTGSVKKGNALWAELETHYAPSITAEDLATLRSLDDDALDDKLTATRFEQAKAKLMKGRLRSYHVDHSTGKVAPAYWDAIGADGKTNLRHRKRLLQKTPKRDRKAYPDPLRQWLDHDVKPEVRKTISRCRQTEARDATREAEPHRALDEANTAAADRKAKLRVAMQPDPATGLRPSMSEVLRRPEFDLWSRGPKPRGRVTENASA